MEVAKQKAIEVGKKTGQLLHKLPNINGSILRGNVCVCKNKAVAIKKGYEKGMEYAHR